VGTVCTGLEANGLDSNKIRKSKMPNKSGQHKFRRAKAADQKRRITAEENEGQAVPVREAAQATRSEGAMEGEERRGSDTKI
jgi:hypothetical protein